MTKPARPSLASLSDRLARKDQAPAPAAPPEHEPQPQQPAGPAHGGRVQVLVRMLPKERKALRRIALDQDRTVQDLVEEAIRDILRRHGVEPS